MGEARFERGVILLLTALGGTLLQCEPASEGDDAGAAGDAGAGNASGVGASGGASGGGGSGGTTAGAGGNSGKGGSAGSGNASGTGGSSAGKGGGAGTGGTATASCDNPTLVTTRGPAPQPVDEATFTAQWPALVCAAMKPGCDSSSTAYDEAKCLAYAPTALDTTLRYDALEAANCLETLRLSTYASAGTLDYRGLPAPCYYVYRGETAPGEACDRDEECAPDPRGPVWCDFDTAVCTVLVRGKLGDPCHVGCELDTDSGSCYPLNEPEEPGVEVTCHNEDGLRCVFGGTCQPSIPTGCPCTLGDSAYCNAASDCTEGAGQVCKARGAAGTPCVLHSECVPSTYCARAGSGVCTARKNQGEACEDHDECMGSSCQGGACAPDSGFGRGRFDDAFCDGTGT